MSADPKTQVCGGCVKPGDVQTGTPAGKIEQYAGIDCYVTGDNKEAAIIYLTDIFGYKFINHQLLADKYAAAGFTVIIPNTLKSGPMASEGYSVYAMEKFFEWFPNNPIEYGHEVAMKVGKQMKEDFGSVQAVGFCIGARLVVDLLKLEPQVLKAGVVYHPTFLTAEEAPQVKQPMRFNLASREEIYTPDVRAKWEEAQDKIPGSERHEYPGTEHGFGARPEGEEAHKSSAEAALATIEFFKKQK